jgi:hypothetical protein
MPEISLYRPEGVDTNWSSMKISRVTVSKTAMKTMCMAAVMVALAQVASAQLAVALNPCDCYDYRSQYFWNPGPEITGRYGDKYLYSCETGEAYADPMYYHGQRALRRWKSVRGRLPAPPPPLTLGTKTLVSDLDAAKQ